MMAQNKHSICANYSYSIAQQQPLTAVPYSYRNDPLQLQRPQCAYRYYIQLYHYETNALPSAKKNETGNLLKNHQTTKDGRQIK